jgi:hypothetical protein
MKCLLSLHQPPEQAVQSRFDNLPSALPQIQSGNLRAIAVTTAERSSLLPELPTIAEFAIPDLKCPSGLLFTSPVSSMSATRCSCAPPLGWSEHASTRPCRCLLDGAGTEVAPLILSLSGFGRTASLLRI